MFSLTWQLQVLHVLGNIFWIGAIVAVGMLLVAPSPGTARDRGALARRIYTSLAVPAFALSFVTGVLRLFLDLRYYFVVTHFMHAKLPLALGVIAIHHIIGARAKRMAASATEDAGRVRVLTPILAILAAASAWLALTEPFSNR